jgi:ribose 5-phosphate isomerase B
MNKFRLAIGCDHAGFDLKELIKKHLEKEGYPVSDFGTHSNESVDYPDYVHPLANSIEAGTNDFGILICGSANGVAITANKHKHIRAAIAWENVVASLAKKHNDANVLCLPARFITADQGIEFTMTFLNTSFEGGRHAMRVKKITADL